MNQDSPQTNAIEWSVSELSGALKRTLEDSFGYVRLRGEISGYRGPHSSGHVYFSLKDQSAKIDAVIWKGSFSRMRFKPEEGLEVIATGKITTFPGKSSYQIIIDSLEPAGVGALMALLEERKQKLAAEGLFAAERKQALPYLPEVVGVVTSPTGAVIRDILHRLQDRFPRRVLVWPVRVQGEGSAEEVAAAIRGFNSISGMDGIPRPDVLIVARGGGSIEDLWGFNEEIVVRAASESAIPLISAVGHETDWTLIDYVADVRAPTPTGAAEMAVPVRSELLATVNNLSARHGETLLRLVDRRRTELRSAARALPQPDMFLAIPRQRLDLATAKLKPALATNLRSFETKLSQLQNVLQRFSPAAQISKIAGQFDAIGDRPHDALLRLFEQKKRALTQSVERLNAARGTLLRAESQRISQQGDILRKTAERVPAAMAQLLTRKAERLASLVQLFDSLNYKSVLSRGYALVRDASGVPVRFAANTMSGQGLQLEFADGAVAVTVNGDHADEPQVEPVPVVPKPSVADVPPPPRKVTPTKTSGGNSSQGSLF
ncbi:exodeoxyribonuclease VII large subunit [Microvirga sp. W0021]|uniref:Exodeoxyribonuclease 7 large subunit n=1 Tax=Hohaiivirga grylli TaxID=3133970 RepID=A0ABV0BH92_9HYPH